MPHDRFYILDMQNISLPAKNNHKNTTWKDRLTPVVEFLMHNLNVFTWISDTLVINSKQNSATENKDKCLADIIMIWNFNLREIANWTTLR